MRVYLIADESGAKGYQDRSESYQGETGVFGGYLVDQNRLTDLKRKLSKVAVRYFPNTTKYHIADLQDNLKGALREDVFDVLARNVVTCVYEAIHVEGFKAEHDGVASIKNDASAVRKSAVKISDNLRKESLHEALFQGLFAKAIAYCIDNWDRDYHLTILTDRLDRAVFDGIGRAASNLVKFAPSQKQVSGWDPRSWQVVKGTISVSVQIPTSLRMDDIATASFELQMDEENSPLVLGADILANSINYIFRTRAQGDIGKPLNDRNAVRTHDLYSHFYGFLDDGEQLWMSDAMYSYPRKDGATT